MANIKKIVLILAAAAALWSAGAREAAATADPTGLTAVPGDYNGTAILSWTSPETLSPGDKFYVQYSTDPALPSGWSSAAAQVVVSTELASAGQQTLRVSGLEYGRDASAAAFTYTFKLWIEKSSVLSNPASAVSAPLTPPALSTSVLSLAGGTAVVVNSASGGYGVKMALDADGDTYLYSTLYLQTSTAGAASGGAYLAKFAPSGAALWYRAYSSTLPVSGYGWSGDWAGGMAVGPDGALVTAEIADGGANLMVRKVSASGEILWTVLYPVPLSAGARINALTIGSSNEIYLAGEQYGATGILWLVKLDQNGGKTWEKQYPNAQTGTYSASGLALYGTDLYVAGTRNVGYNNDIFVGKFTQAAGLLSASATFGGTDYDYGRDIKADASGVYVTGERYSSASYNYVAWTAKLNTSLSLQWEDYFSNSGNPAYGAALALDPLGNLLVTGREYRYDIYQGSNLLLLKYSPAGRRLLARSVDYNGRYEQGFDVKSSSLGVIYAAGSFLDGLGYYRLDLGSASSALFADKGPYTGSVALNWLYQNDLPGGSQYYVQYSTYASFNWSTQTASAFPVGPVSAFSVQGQVVGGLQAARDANNAVSSPVYYFRAWYSDGVSLTALAGPVTSYAFVPDAPAEVTFDSADGNLLRVLSGAGVISPYSGPSLARDAAGNVYELFRANFGPAAADDFGVALRKYSPSGAVLWTRFYHGANYATYDAAAITVDPSGNPVIVGKEYAPSLSQGDNVWVSKISPSGEQLWTRTYNGSGNGSDYARGVAADGAGNIYVVGGVYQSAQTDLLVLKYDPDGGGPLAATYAGPDGGTDDGASVDVGADGRVYVAGRSYYTAATAHYKMVFLKYDTNLSLAPASPFGTWGSDPLVTDYVGSLYTAGDDGDDIVYGVKVSTWGDVYAAGYVYDTSYHNNDSWAGRIDPSGVLVSTKVSGVYYAADEFRSLAITSAGEVLAAGYETYPQPAMWLQKLGQKDLSYKWYKRYLSAGKSGMITADSIAQAANGDLLLGVIVATTPYSQAGYFRFSPPTSGLSAAAGSFAGGAELTWIADSDLPAGATFYVQASTWAAPASLASAKAYTSLQAYNSGALVRFTAGDLTAGRDAAGNATPPYYFRAWYSVSAGSTLPVAGAAAALPAIPATVETAYTYPLGRVSLIGGVGSASQSRMARDPYGNIYMSFNNMLRKYSASGALQWTRFYTSGYGNSVYGLAADQAGNVYISGSQGGSYITDPYVAKYSPAGQLLWARVVESAPYFEGFWGVAPGQDGYVYLSGTYDGSGAKKALLAKYSPDGVLVSSAAYKGSYASANGNGIAYNAADGKLYVAGAAAPSSNTCFWVARFGTDLAFEADRLYCLTGNSAAAKALAVDTAGNLYATGNISTYYGMLTVKLAPDLSELWTSTYTATAAAGGCSSEGIALDGAGGLYTGGYESRNDLGQSSNLFFRKYSAGTGDVMWTNSFNALGGSYETGYSIAVDTAGYVYVPGVFSYPQGSTYYQYYSGYFRYRQASISSYNPALTVAVTYNGSSAPLKDVNVALLGFNQMGNIDPAATQLGLTGADGRFTARVSAGYRYFIGLSTPGYIPSMKDQMMDPNGNFYATLMQDTTRSFQLYPRAAADPAYTLTLNVTAGLVSGDYLMGEVYVNRTGERVAYGVAAATDTAGRLQVFNVPAAPAGTYAVSLSMPRSNKFLNFFLDSAFPGVSAYSVDMSSAVSVSSGYDTAGSTVPPSFQGVVRSSETSVPLGGARVQLYMVQCTGPDSCSTTVSYENITDANGQFTFYSVPYSSNPYNVDVKIQGYRSWYDQVLISSYIAGAAVAVAPYREYALEVATYTLTGVVKYNGTPVPNARIMVSGDDRTYPGDDSYSGWWEASMKSDAQARSGADGSFLIAGLPDGRLRMSMEFMGNWRDLNSGADAQSGTADDIRLVISSDTSRGPSLPGGNPCRPGRTWMLDADGACQAAGALAFNITPSGGNSYGRLYGTLVFVTTYPVSAAQPLVIPAAAPVTLMATQDCNDGDCNNRQLGFVSVSGTFFTSSTTYSVTLSSGFSYYSSVMSGEWGKLSNFDDRVDLTSTDTVRMDFTLTRSGGIRGAVKMPDGTSFRPYYSPNEADAYYADVQVQGVNLQYSAGTGLDEFGNYEFPNLPPGIYDVYLKPRGGAFRWPPVELDNVQVSVGNTVEANLRLQDGLVVQPQIFGLPALSTASWQYTVIGVPSGFQMNQKNITEMFFEEPQYSFNYSTVTASWDRKYMVPGQYDFYLLVGVSYNPGGGDQYRPQSYYQFANFIGRVKNVSVQKSDSNPGLGSLTQPIPLNILGSLGQAEMKGRVVGTRIFTDADFERIFANFDAEIQQIIPAVMLYDNAGDLRAFTDAMPDENGIASFEAALRARDKQGILDSIAADPLRYYVWGLPPGRYTAVFANPNYPPVAADVTLPREEDPLPVFDFDAQNIIVGSVYGVVRSSATGGPLPNATVYLKHRTVEKYAVTDSSGAFRFANLPTGIYRLEVTRDGYVKTGVKTSLAGNDSAGFSLYMLPSESLISGKVYTSKFPAAITKAGVKVVAYDETQNVESPSSYLPKLEVQTDDGGAYVLRGVVPGHIYKISAMYTGKLPELAEVTAQEGETLMDDIVLRDVPPQITVKVRKSPDSVNKVDVEIRSPRELISTPVCLYNPGGVYDSTAAVSLALVPGPNNTFLGQFTVSSAQRYYTVYVSAGDSGKMEKSVVYDQNSDAKTEQYIQEEAIAGGEISMDAEKEEYSGIELDAGTLSYSTTSVTDFSNLVGGFFSALPSVKTVKTAKGNVTLEAAVKDLMASEVYNLDLSNAQPNKPFTLTLKYDKERALNTGGLRICQYDDASGSWKEVPGSYTVDPMTGVVSVDVSSLELAYAGSGGVTTPLGRKRLKMSAVRDGRYVPSDTSPAAQTGKFAVFTAKPPTGTAAYSSAFEVYNMPNPFNLKAKTVSVSSDGQALLGSAYTTSGTLIKYNLPAGKSGSLKFVIYNLVGEKVRTIDEGHRDGDQVYYSEWDGRNDNNQECASGVYFMLTYLDGKKLGRKAHKMAVIK